MEDPEVVQKVIDMTESGEIAYWQHKETYERLLAEKLARKKIALDKKMDVAAVIVSKTATKKMGRPRKAVTISNAEACRRYRQRRKATP